MATSLKSTANYLLPMLCGTLAITDEVKAQEKPNILWLWTEDMSYYNLGVTGNTLVQTPNVDSLATHGVLFTRAFSCGPQSSPARSSLITGMYSFSTGSDWHRQSRAVPDEFYFPQYLKNEGYYTTNNNKTDYNSTVKNSLMWSVNSSSAHYKNRTDKAKPFFAVFNCGYTHMSSITDTPIPQRTNRKVSPSNVTMQPYLPQGDSLKDDRAWHLDKVIEMDAWIGQKLQELRDQGEDENTIIFFSSDHGGSTPGSKGFLRHDGIQVPLIAYFPPKWAHLKNSLGNLVDNYKSDRMVGFVDLGPTVLSLANIAPKPHFHGKPFLGEYATAERENIITFRCNQGEAYIPARSLIDDRYKFIWNYNTLWRKGMRNGFQWGMEGYVEWERMFYDGELSGIHQSFWQQDVAFELYDLQNDSQELTNLAYLPEYQTLVEKYKTELGKQLREIKDLGLYPKTMRRQTDSEPFYDYVRRVNEDTDRVIETAEIASCSTEANTEELTTRLSDKNPAVRYWAALGLARIAMANENPAAFPDQLLLNMLQDASELTEVKSMVASALACRGYDCEALSFLVEKFTQSNTQCETALEGLNEHIQPASQQIVRIVEQIKEGGTNYKNTSVAAYARLLRYARVLDYSTSTTTNLTLWQPFLENIQSQVGDDCFEFVNANTAPESKDVVYDLSFNEKFEPIVYSDSYTDFDAITYLANKGWQVSKSHPSVRKVNAVAVRTIEEGGYVATPKINVSSATPLNISFYARMALNDIGNSTQEKTNNNLLHRNFFAVIGNDTIYKHINEGKHNLMQNLNKWTTTYMFDAESPIRIKFFALNNKEGVWAGKTDGLTFGNNKGTGIEIKEASATETALNIAFGENINLGTVTKGTSTLSFPLKGVNIKSPITLTNRATTISLTNTNFAALATNENPVQLNEQVNVNINVQFDAEIGSTFTELVVLSMENTPNRNIWLTYQVGEEALSTNKINSSQSTVKVQSISGGINITSQLSNTAKVFSIDGLQLSTKNIEANSTIFVPLNNGIYIVKVASEIVKVSVN